MTPTLVAAAALVAVLAASAPPPSPAPSLPTGAWRTAASHGRVVISECGGGLCGRVDDSAEIEADPNTRDWRNADPALRARRLKGALLFENLRGHTPAWSGRLYNPLDGHVYSGTMTLLSPDRLKLRGCVFAPLCKTEVWVRIP